MRHPTLLLCLLASAFVALPAAAAAEVQARVKNGDAVAPGEFRWTAALVFDGGFADESQFCGGTVADATTVITAAHCVAGMTPGGAAPQPNGVEIVANRHSLLNPDESQISDESAYIDVAEIHVIATSAGVDPDSTEPVPRDDVAVLELASPIPSPTAVPPVDAEATNPADDALWTPGADLEVSGWGRMEGDEYPTVMRHATVDRISDGVCEDQYGSAGDSLFSPVDMLCALREDPPGTVIDSCDGDSGGPLVSTAADRELVGIVSWGSPECDDPATGGVYTRVAAPDINAFIKNFLDGNEGNDPPAQPAHLSGVPGITGVQRVGDTVTCAATGGETFSSVPDEYDLRLRIGFEFEGWTTVERTGYVAGDSTPGPIQYELTDAEEGGFLACELYAKRNDAGGYGVASSFDPDTAQPVGPRPASGGTSTNTDTNTDTATDTTTPPPALPPTVPPVLPPVNPPVVVPRDEGAPRTARVSRRCKRRVCTLNVFTSDTTTGGAAAAGVMGIQVRLTSKFRCVKRGRRATCVRRRTLTARPTGVPGRFRLTTPKLRRGLHSLRITAVDAAGNREARALTYSFRLR